MERGIVESSNEKEGRKGREGLARDREMGRSSWACKTGEKSSRQTILCFDERAVFFFLSRDSDLRLASFSAKEEALADKKV